MAPMHALIAAELVLRGAVAAVLSLHVLVLLLPGPRPAARLALAGFAASLVGYLATQRPDGLLWMPRPVALALLLLAVTSTAWCRAAMRALFDDGFRFGALEVALLAGMAALGMAANVPWFPPPGELEWQTWPAGSWPDRLSVWHGAAMLGFSIASLREVLRGWSADLVEVRRAARRWIGLGVALYGGVAVVVELALRGHAVGRLLPAVHVAGIGAVAALLMVLLVRHSLDDLLGLRARPAPPAGPAAAPAPPPPPDPALAVLERAMTHERLYRQEGLTLAGLAQQLGLGETALRTLINQQLGFRNFPDFLHHHRLAEAQARLAAEDLPVLSIALDCGYGSIGPFNRAFKARFGMTPTEFRAAARVKAG